MKSWWKRAWKKLHIHVSCDKFERELNEELSYHIEKRVEDNIAAGMSPEEARLAAQRSFGNPVSLRERARDAWRLPLEDFFHDLAFSLRIIGRKPAYSATIIITLLFAVAINISSFSVLNAVLLRPLAYNDPERLVNVWLNGEGDSISKMEFVELRKRTVSFAAMAAYTGWSITMTGREEPVILDGARATGDFFAMLGVRAELGRTFLPDEDQPGKSDVVVLTRGGWQRRFGSDPGIVGKSILLDGIPREVIGVMPANFRLPDRQFRMQECDFILPAPIDVSDANDYKAGYLKLMARLKPGVLAEQARAEVISKAAGMRDLLRRPPDDYGKHALVVPLQKEIAGESRTSIHLLTGAAILVFLAACASVANLQLARTAERQREVSVRVALGAGRGRIARQILTESVLLAAIGGGAGIPVAAWSLKFLDLLLPSDIPRVAPFSMDLNVLLFSVGAILFAAVFSGIASVWQLSRSDPQAGLKEGSHATIGTAGQLRRYLVAAEVTLAVVLLMGTGLLVKSLWYLYRVDPGFIAGGVISLRLAPAGPQYQDNTYKQSFYREVLTSIRQLPGVVSAGAIHLLPMGDNNWNPSLQVEDFPQPSGAALPSVDWRLVTPEYFQTLRIGLIRGRYFSESDHSTAAPVAIVNETLAKRYWGSADVIGRRVRSGFEGSQWVPIVGVVRDVKEQGVAQNTNMELYRPYEQASFADSMTLMIRSTGNPFSLVPTVRAVVWKLDKNVPVADVQLLSSVVSDSMRAQRSMMLLVLLFAAIALLLGTVGIYGVVACFVNQRIPEIGIRMALGAKSREVRLLVFRQVVMPAVSGTFFGLVLAYWLSRLITGFLYGVRPNDPFVYASVIALIIVACAAAAVLPARKASRIDPLQALRYE